MVLRRGSGETRDPCATYQTVLHRPVECTAFAGLRDSYRKQQFSFGDYQLTSSSDSLLHVCFEWDRLSQIGRQPFSSLCSPCRRGQLQGRKSHLR
jgi:hypothetical protein